MIHEYKLNKGVSIHRRKPLTDLQRIRHFCINVGLVSKVIKYKVLFGREYNPTKTFLITNQNKISIIYFYINFAHISTTPSPAKKFCIDMMKTPYQVETQ